MCAKVLRNVRINASLRYVRKTYPVEKLKEHFIEYMTDQRALGVLGNHRYLYKLRYGAVD